MRHKVNMHICCSPELKDWLQNTAHNAGLSVSKLIELLADNYRGIKPNTEPDYAAMMAAGMKHHCNPEMRNGKYALMKLKERRKNA